MENPDWMSLYYKPLIQSRLGFPQNLAPFHSVTISFIDVSDNDNMDKKHYAKMQLEPKKKSLQEMT